MTKRKTKIYALISLTAFTWAFILWAVGPRMPVVEFFFNLNMGVSGFLLVFRVLGPLLITSVYYGTDNTAFRARFEASYVFSTFFLIKEEKNNV